jgi:hypothetical protein
MLLRLRYFKALWCLVSSPRYVYALSANSRRTPQIDQRCHHSPVGPGYNLDRFSLVVVSLVKSRPQWTDQN